MKKQNRVCDRPLGVTFVAGALCTRGSGHNFHAPLHWLLCWCGGAFLSGGGGKGASSNDDAVFINPGGGDVTFKSGQKQEG